MTAGLQMVGQHYGEDPGNVPIGDLWCDDDRVVRRRGPEGWQVVLDIVAIGQTQTVRFNSGPDGKPVIYAVSSDGSTKVVE